MGSLIAHEAQRRIAGLAAAQQPGDVESAEQALTPWLTVIDVTAAAQSQIDSNVNINLVCDNLVSKIDRALTA
jgi:hypothetical protein